ncbi:daunorubicin resistance protein DrrA family ABC transporter ATP-binding protein [Kribbella albertanoniae]|uniref:ABC transporter ATP-binding protein n=1 Tax=Kribbella albertanoniae TaxID=1266829 RepID=A0A4V2XSY4_9ACTN|nr:ABC transporter ATP-binding protein [Kribbella albertanoniae]TDC35525.1 ABC transporter ATP-binding protein [Kribbella albertanoniae]
MTSTVEVTDLCRSFKTSTGLLWRSHRTTEAVRDLSFSVERGELFGLLGPNGAGKTTTIKMLITLLLPTSGVARVLGIDVARDPQAVRSRIGYVFGGERGLYERLSAADNLRYFAELYGVSPRSQRTRIAELLELVDLSGREKERVEGFSRGMRQRLHIARGLLHDPEVLFLDEPTIGIDPVGARQLRELVVRLREAGKTILLTTHYMLEADLLCDRIAVIDKGQLLALGTPTELKSSVDIGQVIEVETFGLPQTAIDRIETLDGVRTVTASVRGHLQLLVVQGHPGAEVTGSVLAAVDDQVVHRVLTREPTLEDAYVALVGGS